MVSHHHFASHTVPPDYVSTYKRGAAPAARVMNTTEGKYGVELFTPGGEGAGLEAVLDRHDSLEVARAIYRGRIEQFPGRLVMLCDRARVLPRSDRPETMP